MGEKPDQIERHLYEERNELAENINKLQQKVKSAVDWRVQVEERPWTMVGIAFGGGLLLSMLLGGGRNSHRASRDSSRRRSRSEFQRSEYAGGGSTQEWEGKSAGMWDNIRDAALAVAGTRLSSFIEHVLPGFREQYRKKQQQASSTPSRHNGPESVWRRTASGETDYMPQN